MQLVVGTTLWNRLIELVRATERERAFYLVGIEDATKLYILEAFEFCYAQQTEYSIISDPICRILLEATLPINVRIVAILHSHPFAEEPFLSSIDLTLAQEYPNTPIITLTPWGKATAKVVKEEVGQKDNPSEVDIVIVRDEDIRPIIVPIDKYYGVFIDYQIKIIDYMIPIKYAQLEWRILSASKYQHGRILRPKIDWVGIIQTYLIPHMLMGELKKRQLEYLQRQELVRTIINFY